VTSAVTLSQSLLHDGGRHVGMLLEPFGGVGFERIEVVCSCRRAGHYDGASRYFDSSPTHAQGRSILQIG
jgi:hypothetical protein